MKKIIITILLGLSLASIAYGATFYTTAGDGEVYKSDDPSWTTTQTATTGSGYDYTDTFTQVAGAYSFLLGDYFISRTFFPFDTSAIPSHAVITSAILYFKVSTIADVISDVNSTLSVIQTDQPSSSVLASADYNNASATSSPTASQVGGVINISALSTTTYNTITLDSDGLSWIKKNGETSNCGTTAGITCLGIREGHDLYNSNPGSSIHSVIMSTHESSSVPYLEITYTIPTPLADLQVGSGTLQVGSGTLQITN